MSARTWTSRTLWVEPAQYAGSFGRPNNHVLPARDERKVLVAKRNYAFLQPTKPGVQLLGLLGSRGEELEPSTEDSS